MRHKIQTNLVNNTEANFGVVERKPPLAPKQPQMPALLTAAPPKRPKIEKNNNSMYKEHQKLLDTKTKQTNPTPAEETLRDKEGPSKRSAVLCDAV